MFVSLLPHGESLGLKQKLEKTPVVVVRHGVNRSMNLCDVELGLMMAGNQNPTMHFQGPPHSQRTQQGVDGATGRFTLL